MGDHASDEGVYIRSMAARVTSAASRWSTPQAMRVLDAAGFDVVLVETVGVGQSEVEVAGLADTTIVLLAPGMGDGIQAAKAGILEVGDVYVVNKADRDGAAQVARDLRSMLALADRREGAWNPPILKTTAQSGDGVAEVVTALDEHRAWSEGSGELRRRRERRARAEIEAIAVAALRHRWARVGDHDDLAGLAAAVVSGESTRTPPPTGCSPTTDREPQRTSRSTQTARWSEEGNGNSPVSRESGSEGTGQKTPASATRRPRRDGRT